MQVFDDTSYATGVGGVIGFGGNFTSSNSTIFSEIRGIKENATDNNYAGALTFSTRANGGSITERLRINSSGNSLFQGGINLQDSGTNKVWLTRAETILGGSDDDFLIYTETGLNIRLYTSGNERLRVDSSGNVGIGTTSPDVKAHIFGGPDSQENVMLKVQSNGVANDGSLSTSILLANSTGLTSIHGAKISAIRTSSSTDD